MEELPTPQQNKPAQPTQSLPAAPLPLPEGIAESTPTYQYAPQDTVSYDDDTKRSRLFLVIIGIAFVIFIIAVITLISVIVNRNSSKNDSNAASKSQNVQNEYRSIFQAMFEKSLAVTSVVEDRIATVKNGSVTNSVKMTITYDLKNPSGVLMQISEDRPLGGITSMRRESLEYIVTPEEIYAKFTKIDGIDSQKLGTWFLLADSSGLNADASVLIPHVDISSLRQAYLGHYLTVNFDKNAQATLRDQLRSNPPYSYNASSVRAQKDDLNKDRVVFEVTVNASNLMNFNTQAATFTGRSLNQSLQSAISRTPSPITVWTDKQTGYISRIDNAIPGVSETIRYRDYNKSTSISKPSSITTSSQMRASLEGELKTLRSSAN